jgi:hypothetical protein
MQLNPKKARGLSSRQALNPARKTPCLVSLSVLLNGKFPNKQLHNPQPRKKNQMTKILIAYIIGLIVGAGATLCIVEQLLK